MQGQAEVIGAVLLLVIAVTLWATAWNMFYPTYQQASQRIEQERLLAEKGLREYNYTKNIYPNSRRRHLHIRVARFYFQR
jgi:flagellin-like protein